MNTPMPNKPLAFMGARVKTQTMSSKKTLVIIHNIVHLNSPTQASGTTLATSS